MTCSRCRVFLKLVLQVPLALWGCEGEGGRKSPVSLYLDHKTDSTGRAGESSVETALGAESCWSAWGILPHCLCPRGSQPQPPFPGHKTCLVLAGIPSSLPTNSIGWQGDGPREPPGSNGQKATELGQGESPLPNQRWLPQQPSRKQPDFGALCLPIEEPSPLTLTPSMRNPSELVELSDSLHCM